MKTPKKVIIEISGHEYTQKVLDENGNVIWGDRHVMEGRGRSRGEGDNDVFEHCIGEDYPELAEAIEDLSFGPFGVAGALHDLNEY